MMNYLKPILLWFIIHFISNIGNGQSRFECNEDMIISASDGVQTIIYRPVSIPFSPSFLSAIGSYSGDFDALGFNPKDNYIYCVERNTNNIVRLHNDNTFERIGKVNLTDTLKTLAGDCMADGHFVIYDYILEKILIFDVSDKFTLLKEVKLIWDATTTESERSKLSIYDLTFHPNNPKTAYTISTFGTILKIDLDLNSPNLGMVTKLGTLSSGNFTIMSGLCFNAKSQLFGYSSTSINVGQTQHALNSVDPINGSINPILIINDSRKLFTDACSCPFSLTFTNAVPNEGMYCSNDNKTFSIFIENNSYIALSDVILKDTFPEGTIIKAISNGFQGRIDPGTGVGTNFLSISALRIPAKGKINIDIDISSINAKDGPVYNQAFLYNLPPIFPKFVKSDDPTSSTPLDRSNFYFTTKAIKNLTWKIKLPSDCVKSNDGAIIASSPDFFEGQVFDISLRNKIGWKESSHVVIVDKDKSFRIDSLVPGDYELYRLKIKNENCSVSLKDTTIVVEPPNDQLKVTLNSNSPICEGDILQLSSVILPDYKINWTGPNLFSSENVSPAIYNISTGQKGTYEALASYGFCTIKKEIDVSVKAKFKTKIIGNTNYCEGDTIKLAAQSNQAGLKYIWSTSNSIKWLDSTLLQPIHSQNISGYYEVRSTNGACFDSSGIIVNVFPTPRIKLDKNVLSDFCTPIILDPEISDENNVIYNWTPHQGLTCNDCPKPQVIPIINSEYTLKVHNEFNCHDSTTVTIKLDKKNVIFSPNIISIHGTSANKVFKIVPGCIVHFIHQLDIFDKQGSQIFHTIASSANEDINSWDGTINGQPAAQGVYVWYAKTELIDGSVVYITGDLTVI